MTTRKPWAAAMARRAALFGAALGLISACTSTNTLDLAPLRTDAPKLEYKIGPLDTLNVIVWRNPDLSTTVTVRPDGLVTTPLVQDLQAAGRTPAALSRDIEKALLKFIRDPVVSVVVTNFQGIYSEQIRIVGEAAKPQSVAYRQNMTVLDVMIQAGGMTDYADGNNAILVRGSENGKQYRVRLSDLLRRGDISANVNMLPGDIVIIPQSWF